MNGAYWIWIAIVALVASAVLSALAHSLRDLSRTRLEQMVARRGRAGRVRSVGKILDDQEGHATAIALPRIVCNLSVVVAMVLWIASLRAQQIPTWVEVVIAIAASSLVLWVFGLVLPQAVARHAAERTVYTWSGAVRLTYIVMKPFHAVAAFVDEVVRRLSGRTDAEESQGIQNEIMSAVEDAQQGGKFDKAEREMIEGVVRFRDTTVTQIMTPRTEIEAIEVSASLSRVTSFIREATHSRVPVYEGTPDKVVGVFYVKDLMRWLAGESARTGRTFDLRTIMRPPMFVPETKTVRELLGELLGRRVHIAVVADEYGGTAGIVTMEDIVEEVFGDIQDEYEHSEDTIPDVTVDAQSRCATIDARAYIVDANNALKPLGVELPESEDYDTVGGYVIVTMGRIPRIGERMPLGEAMLMVTKAEPMRVIEVKLDLAPADQGREVKAASIEARNPAAA